MPRHEDNHRPPRVRVRTKRARLIISNEIFRHVPTDGVSIPVRGRYWPTEHLIQLGNFGDLVDGRSKAVRAELSRKAPETGRVQHVASGTNTYFLSGPLTETFIIEAVDVVDLASEMRARHGYDADDTAIYSRHVLVIGAGSLGSGIVRMLSQAGVFSFTIVDRDTFSPANLSRHSGGVSDLGRGKAQVVADSVNRLFGFGRGVCADVTSMPQQHLEALIDQSDLVIATTDSQAANMRINELVVGRQKPALFAQAWEKASAGEVLAYVADDQGPCLYCATGFRLQLAEVAPTDGDALPYQTQESGSLIAEPGLAADLGLIISAAAAYGLALLCPTGRRAGSLLVPARRFLLLQSGNEPLEPFRELHRTPFATAFASVVRSEACPVCGHAGRGAA